MMARLIHIVTLRRNWPLGFIQIDKIPVPISSRGMDSDSQYCDVLRDSRVQLIVGQ